MSNTKLDHFISRALPSVIIEDRPQFALFVQKYFEHLGRELGEYDSVTNLLKYLNVDTTIPDFYDDFKNMYAPLLPDKYKASLSIIVKNIIKFYQTKGTEESFRTFFRMIFDVTVDIYYPKVDMLRTSDGRWIEPYYLYPTDQTYDNQYYFYDKLIVGSLSNATAYVKSVIQIDNPSGPGKVYVLSLVDRTGVFVNNDVITVDGETTPTLTLDGTDAVVLGTGYWEDTEGFLSWNKYLQDSDYYQDYSYELQTSISTSVFEKSVRDNLHPAGLKLFALVSSGITVIDIGGTLGDFIDNIVDWISLENIEQSINSSKYKLSSQVSAPQISGGNDFDWRYFEQNRDDTAFRQLYPISALGSLTIDHISNNYAENFLTVTIDGTGTTLFSILNEVLTLDSALGSDASIVVTTNDPDIPTNSRIFRYGGQSGQTVFILPTKINRMKIGATLAHDILTA